MIELIPAFRLCQDKLSKHIRRHFGDARTADQIGTVLAGYWLLTSSKAITDEQAERLITCYLPGLKDLQEEAGVENEEERVLGHLLSAFLQVEDNDSKKHDRPVSELSKISWGIMVDDHVIPKYARDALRRHGMSAVSSRKDNKKYFFVCRDHPRIKEIFVSTHWCDSWYRLLVRLEGVTSTKARLETGKNGTRRGLYIPLDLVLRLADYEPDDDFGG